jgi:rhodanese-related sulfurtransferase
MSSINTITVNQLGRLIGTPKCPFIIDVRIDDDFALDPRFIPTVTARRSHKTVAEWAGTIGERNVIVICQRGEKLSHGVAAWLRHDGVAAENLEGGFEAWQKSGLPLVPADKFPDRDAFGRTVWVTRERPKIDRIACPWLIRRFVDPNAIFLFTKASEVLLIADRFKAAAFDIEGVHWSHRGERCTFDVMVEEFGLKTDAMLHLATMVRAADTSKLELVPEAHGLLAASLGLSRMYDDDLQQLDAGMVLYDAFYRWCRDAKEETHNWPTNKTRSSK